MSDDKELYHLMANPWKINRIKRKQESYINREFINLLKKKYPSYIIEDSDINIIFENLEESLIDLTRTNLINNFVNSIIESVINER